MVDKTKKYEVKINYSMILEAKNEEEAKAKFREIMDNTLFKLDVEDLSKIKEYKLINRKGYPEHSIKGKNIFNENDIITGTCTVAYFASKFPKDWEVLK